MTTPIYTAAAIDWAIAQGLDNSQITVVLNEVSSFEYYGATEDFKMKPHFGIWFSSLEEGANDAPPFPNHILEIDSKTYVWIYNF